MWHIEGWIAVIDSLRARGYAIVLTGGPAEAEVAYARDIAERVGGEIINLTGRLSLGETAEVTIQQFRVDTTSTENTVLDRYAWIES
jgi:heptosyltransferase-3